MKTFSIGAVATVSTGALLCQFEELYEILSHLVGRPVWTHEIPLYLPRCRLLLLEQLPFLAGRFEDRPRNVGGHQVTEEEVSSYLWEKGVVLGTTFNLNPGVCEEL